MVDMMMMITIYCVYILKNVKLTHSSTPDGKRKVCDMILFIVGPVDWERGPVDWRAWGILDAVADTKAE